MRWGGARLLYLNYDGVRGVPERGCSRGWQPPRMGQWRGERKRGGVGGPLSLRSHRADFADF